MTNEAPQRIWASKGSWPKFYMAPCKDLPLLKEYIRADIAQAEKEAAVAAAYEDAAIRAQSIDHHGWTRTELAAMIRARSNTVEASASHTNALAERDARVRAEVLDAAHKYLCDQYGNSPLGHPIDRKRILSLIPVNQEENLND